MTIWYAQLNNSSISGLNMWSSLPGGGSGFLTWANLSGSDILIANAKTGISCNVGFDCATISTLGNFGGGTGTNGGNFTLPDSITIDCNVVAGTSTCLTRVSSGGTSTIAGNITGSAANNTQYGFSSPGAGQTNITGNITGGAAANAFGILTASSGSVVVTGNVIGGTASYGISASGTGSVTVSGTVSGHATGNQAGGITAIGTVTISVSGNVTAGANSNGIYSTSTAYTLFTAASTWTPSSVGYAAVVCIKPLIPSSGTVTHTYYTNNSGVPGTARSLYTGGLALGHPATTNVRSGTVYGSTSEYTGTLLVPNPAYVSAGVGTDNTVGTLITYLNNPTIVSRSTNDANPITFSWPVSGATITGTVSLNTANYVNVTGAISYSRTEGSKYYYKIAHNSADRTSAEGTARYAFTDGTYTRYATLRITGSSSQASLNTLDDYVDTEVAAIKAKTDQLTFTTANQVDSNALSGGAGLSAEGTRDALGMATANLDAKLATLATPTNITAATGIVLSGVTHTGARIPNVTLTDTATNLTNAATSGDLTQTMKNSVTAIVPTAAQTADQVWDELLSGHATAGSTGAALTAAGSAGDPWSTAVPGSYGAGTAGKILGDNVNATISSRASQTSLDTLDDYVDTEVAAIKAKTDQLTFTVANQVDSNSLSVSATGIRTAVGLATANLDTQISSRASQTSLDTLDDLVDTEVGAIKTKTDQLTFTIANQIDANSLTIGANVITASALATDAVNEIQSGLATPTNITAATGIVLSGVTHTGARIPNVTLTDTATNLTNAPTSGDLTQTMKNSVTAIVPTAAENFAAVLTTALTESYAADNVAPTLAQAIMLIQQSLHEFAINSTTRTVKKLDGATTAATFTLDSATAPTSTTRAT